MRQPLLGASQASPLGCLRVARYGLGVVLGGAGIAEASLVRADVDRAGVPPQAEPARIAQLESIGVTECAFGLPDKNEEEISAYLGHLRTRLDG